MLIHLLGACNYCHRLWGDSPRMEAAKGEVYLLKDNVRDGGCRSPLKTEICI